MSAIWIPVCGWSSHSGYDWAEKCLVGQTCSCHDDFEAPRQVAVRSLEDRFGWQTISLYSFAANWPYDHPHEFGVFGEALSSTFRGFVLHKSFGFTLVGSSRAWERGINSLPGDARAFAAGFGRSRISAVCFCRGASRASHPFSWAALRRMVVLDSHAHSASVFCDERSYVFCDERRVAIQSTTFEELFQFVPWACVTHVLATQATTACLFDAVPHHIQSFD